MNYNGEKEEIIENCKQIIEFPNNYKDIVEFKFKRLEKEYQETLNKNFREEDLQNNEEFNSDSEDQNENDHNDNNYYQCLDGEEFVDVYENPIEEGKNNKIEEESNKDPNNHSDNSNYIYPPENFITNIDESKFEEFVKVSDKILAENKDYIENLTNNFKNYENSNFQYLNNKGIHLDKESCNLEFNNNDSIKKVHVEENYKESTQVFNKIDCENDFEFVLDNSKF